MRFSDLQLHLDDTMQQHMELMFKEMQAMKNSIHSMQIEKNRESQLSRYQNESLNVLFCLNF